MRRLARRHWIWAATVIAILVLLWIVPPLLGIARANPHPPVTNDIEEKLRQVQPGLDAQAVEKLLGVSPRHQFSARIDGTRYDCVSYAFIESFMRYYFVFKDGRLEKIMEPPPFEYEPRELSDGTKYEYKRKSWDPEQRLRETLDREPLDHEAIMGPITKLADRPVSFNVLPAFVITAPLWAVRARDIAKDYERNRELAEKYDAGRIGLGMTEAQVEQAFGRPRHVIQGENGQTVHVYGEDVKFAWVNPALKFSWVAVVFDNGRATRIFSHDFFHEALSQSAERN